MKKKIFLIVIYLHLTTFFTFGQTTNYLAKFNSSGTVVNSNIFDNGNVGLGTQIPINKFTVLGSGSVPVQNWATYGSPIATFFGENAGGNGDMILGFAGNNNYDRADFITRRSRSTLNNPTAVQNADNLGSFLGSGHDGTSFLNTGEITFTVDGTVSTGVIPTAIFFATNGGSGRTERMRITSSGNVGIGISNPAEKFAVNGTIRSKRVKVETANFPDYVFKPTYQLRPLGDLKAYIAKYQHLPEVPSAAEIEKDGQDLGEMNKILLKKVEELTLYAIEADRKLTEANKTNADQSQLLKDILIRVKALENNK